MSSFPKPKLKKKVRETVNGYVYTRVLERDRCCRLCGAGSNLSIHHIVYRSQDKKRINDPSNLIMLCISCHSLCHSNKKKYMEVLKQIIEKSN